MSKRKMYRKPVRHKPDLLLVLVMLVGLGVAASVGFQLHADFRPADMATVKMQPHPVGPIGG